MTTIKLFVETRPPMMCDFADEARARRMMKAFNGQGIKCRMITNGVLVDAGRCVVTSRRGSDNRLGRGVHKERVA